jgi:hypothetical protein
MQIVDLCAPVKIANSAENSVLQAPPRDLHRKLRSIVGTCLSNHCIATVAALTA